MCACQLFRLVKPFFSWALFAIPRLDRANGQPADILSLAFRFIPMTLYSAHEQIILQQASFGRDLRARMRRNGSGAVARL